MSFDELIKFGWDGFFEKGFRKFSERGLVPGRVSFQNQHLYRVYIGDDEVMAEIAGRLRFAAKSNSDLPAVGDWVALKAKEGSWRIHGVLERKTQFARKTVGAKTEAQIVGANVDVVFLVTSLNQDFNLRRVERYLANVWDSGAQPVVVLSKSDLCESVEVVRDFVEKTTEVTRGAPVHAVSVRTGVGMAELLKYCGVGRTIALVGTSGVGKSSLINFFLGEDRQAVKVVREHDDRGQHTTRHRELILLPDGGLVLDTPGMRELQLWDAEAGLEGSFDDIANLAVACFYSNCRHQTEPKCAVREAIEAGGLDRQRVENFVKMTGEVKKLTVRQEDFKRKEEQKQWNKLSRAAKETARDKRKGA